MQGASIAAEHRPEENRLRRGNRSASITHGGPGNQAALDDKIGFHSKEGRLPDDQIGKLADLDGADFVSDSVRDGGVNGELCYIAPDP